MAALCWSPCMAKVCEGDILWFDRLGWHLGLPRSNRSELVNSSELICMLQMSEKVLG
jgi:hypothetical protein